MIASDMLGRICFGLDLEPKFCDVIVKRFIKYCKENNKAFTIKLNGETIDENYFEE
jgi:DNA modification methylase